MRMPDSEQPESDSDDLDDKMMWEDVEDFEQSWSSGEPLSCFAHSLQLVVNGGMKEVKAVARAISKVTKFTTLLHRSSKHRDMFEAHFEANRSIPAANNTCWNSTFKQLKALTTLDHQAVTEMCSECDTENVVFSAREWAQLKDLCALLEPFSEATDLPSLV